MKSGNSLVQEIMNSQKTCTHESPYHWTDGVTEFPIFDTVVDARGHRGNIITVSAVAQSYLLDLGVPYETVQKLSDAMAMAVSYDDAINLVEKWFKVVRSDEEDGMN